MSVRPKHTFRFSAYHGMKTYRKECDTVAEIVMGQTCSLKDGRAALPENPVPAMAYVPFQNWGEVYEPERALDAGTLFPVLDKPFYGRKGVEPR